MGSNALCRLCLCASDYLIDVFTGNVEQGFVVKETIEDLLQIEVIKIDGLPWFVCSSCVEKLSSFRLFKNRCIESKIAYENRFNRKEYLVKGAAQNDEENSQVLVSVKLEEVDSDEESENDAPKKKINDGVAADKPHIAEYEDRCLMEHNIGSKDGNYNESKTTGNSLPDNEDRDGIPLAKSSQDHGISLEEEPNQLPASGQELWPSNVVCVSLGNSEELPSKRFYMDANGTSYNASSESSSTSSISAQQRKVTRNKNMTLELKLKIIERLERGERAASIARDLSIPPTTVRSIWQRAGAIKNAVQNIASIGMTKVTRIRSNVMERMENLLALWIEEQNYQDNPLSMRIIMEKARELHSSVKQEEGETSAEETFNASRGWFERFKRRSNLRCIKIFGETACAAQRDAEKCSGSIKAV